MSRAMPATMTAASATGSATPRNSRPARISSAPAASGRGWSRRTKSPTSASRPSRPASTASRCRQRRSRTSCSTSPALIAYCSTFTELVPGDVIVTGTTGGVGAYRTPPLWMKDGDVVEVEVSGIGVLRNPVKDEVAGRCDARRLNEQAINNKSKERHHEPAKAPAADHRRRQLSAAGMAGRSRDAVEGGAAHAPACDVAAAGRTSGGSAGRRHHRRDQGHGARRHRHRHRRRNPPRELFQPLCDRARRHR